MLLGAGWQGAGFGASPASPAHPAATPAGAAPAVGDGLDGLRAETGARGQRKRARSREDKLAEALQDLKEKESFWLLEFKDARDTGALRLAGCRNRGPGPRPAPPLRARERACEPCAGRPLRAGKEQRMDFAGNNWRFYAELMEQLRRDPEEYLRIYGATHGFGR